ncbi:TetR/AcrR family transcriptional regulator [Mycobacterium sp. pUA109]|uniref:TetR/AcrR family transcriptional regulator n=1 Tax=Mycobacterium sp. pUA109 TaxID=3238982 RepID=UPI00351B1381
MAPPVRIDDTAARASRARRRYDMDLRQRQADQTSRCIVDALITLVSENAAAPESISVPDVAKRANVSVATVYRHFGTKDALFAAIASVAFEEFSGSRSTPRLETLAEALRSMFRQMHQHEGFVRATLSQQRFGREVRRRREPDRAAMIASLLEPVSDRLSAQQGAGLGLLIRMLTSGPAYLYLTDKGGCDPDEAAALASWAVVTLVGAADENPPPATSVVEDSESLSNATEGQT